MMGLFGAKFAVGAAIASHPERARSIAFAATVCSVYGLFSGAFLARAMALLKLRGGDGAHPVAAPDPA